MTSLYDDFVFDQHLTLHAVIRVAQDIWRAMENNPEVALFLASSGLETIGSVYSGLVGNEILLTHVLDLATFDVARDTEEYILREGHIFI